MTKLPQIHPVVYVVAGLAAAYGVWYVIDKITNPNRGTAYEGTGALGTLGNVTDKVLGGAPSALGSAIGSKLYDIIGSDPDESYYLDYTFKFANGTGGAINSGKVAPDWSFTYKDGKRYKLQQDASGKRFAVPV